MSENDRTRASISANVTEICQGHAALGIPVEEDEFLEAWEILCRIEERLRQAKLEAWQKRWALR